MDWNPRPSSLWEWDNLFDLGNPKKTDYSVESLQSPGASGSELGHASSKSSVSAGCESKSSNKFTLDGFEPASAGSAEPLLSLKLGKRTYFKDINATSSSSAAAAAAKRNKSSSQAPRCQVEGCNLDLSAAKDYHKKHRICENHSKTPRVVVGGIERRFCQQCSRFHGLSEFDEKKRSCRRRLSDHNARRRKPQPEPVRLSSTRFSSLYDEPQKMSLVYEQTPRFSWDCSNNSDGSKFGHTREYFSRPSKTAVGATTQAQILLPNNHHHNQTPSNIPTLYPHGSSRVAPSKTTGTEFLHSGLEESVVASELNTTQDLHRALSLLSTSSWSSREAKTVSINTNTNNNTNNNTTSHNNNAGVRPGLGPMNHSSLMIPLGSSDLWITEQPAIETGPASMISSASLQRGSVTNTSSHFQDLHLFKAPSESGFYSYQY